MNHRLGLIDFIVASIDEALSAPHGGGLTAREIYLRGFERYEQYQFSRHNAALRREFEKANPLLAQKPE